MNHVDLDALKARLAEYDDTLPRCLKPVLSVVTPPNVNPCCLPLGHADECRNSRHILGWPGLATLRALIAEVENLRAHRELCTANLLKGYEAGKVEERAAVVAWLHEEDADEFAASEHADFIERGEHRDRCEEKP